jgi:hypothetical protein
MKKDPIVIIYEPRVDYLNLYCLNLAVYVNAKYIVCSKFDETIGEIKKQNPDLVLIGLTEADKVSEKLLKINGTIKDKFVKPICFVQAKSTEKFKEITLYDADVSVKEVVSTVAKKMGITAKYMAEQNVGEFYPIPLKYILPGWQATQTFYKKNASEEMSVALPKGQIFTKDIIDLLGVENDVYCKSSYRLEVVNSFTSNIKTMLESETMPVEERFQQTEIAFEMVSQSISNIGLPETTMQLAKTTIRSMEKIVGQVNSLSKLYKLLLNDNQSLRFKHSLIASYLGQFVLKDQSWNNPNIIQQWSYLCFFHDIVFDRDELILYEYDDDVKKAKISDKDKAIILNHAQMSAKVVSQAKEIPLGVDVLIKQHHGSKMGNSLSEISMSISPLCIIFILVENYVHFILSNNESVKKPEEIITFIDTLFKKYPYPNYKKMIPLLRTIPLKD